MTIQERMIPRSEREKDLLKFGRSQERERIIKLLQNNDELGYALWQYWEWQDEETYPFPYDLIKEEN